MSSLPIAQDCEGCGVCCFQMGFPTFMLPAEPLSECQIAADPELSQRAKDPEIRKHLLDGHPGESYWHELPKHLRDELTVFWETHADAKQDLNGPCIWLDPNTRQCKHHEHRPRVCRDFEIGNRECREWREVFREQILPANI